MTPEPRRADAVVVGAGQAGLAVAYHLRRLGMTPGEDLLIVDRGPRTGGAWQHRWESLRLGDAHRVHDLPGMADTGLSFDTAPTGRPAREVVPEYYAAYEEHWGLRVMRPAHVSRVTASARGYRMDVAGHAQSIDVRVLVSATGTWHRPRVPTVPGRELFSGRQLTTPGYRAAADFTDQRVAVVGGGTSALGFLAELDGSAASLAWYTRRPPRWWELSSALTEERGLTSVALQDEAARAGKPLPSIVSTTGLAWSPQVTHLHERGLLERRPMFARVHRDGVVEADGSCTVLETIIWATGFNADLGHLDPLAVESSRGAPAVEGGAVAGCPGLYLAGYGPQASTVSSNRAGRTMARAVMRDLGER